jgi:hypothetical protein
MTNCTTVKQLMQELINFNPEARLEPSIDVGGNLATECQLVVDQSKIVALEKRLEKIQELVNAEVE